MMMKHNNSSNSNNNNNRSNSIGIPTPPSPNASINIKDVDRRKVSSELAEIMHDICAIKKSLYYGRKLSKEDEAYFLDEILLGMVKINEYVVNYDMIKFH